ncbi:MAG: acyltransferase [Fibrobacter sp.]|mgnify:CR=1 FL=1|jgi:peptidoglycan/LPS O-acetylase OafA/YrhL|nr:acyltransferase [Fibrobacter sp.]
MKKNRLLELDALRGIAALAVVVYHYFYRYNELHNRPDDILNWVYFGKYGAQFFFIISGFVIYWTLSRVDKPLDFLISRFSRLYPVYWVAVIITFSIVAITGLPGKEVSIYEALCNLLMFHEYFKIPHVDGVYWTLTVELTFYFWIFILYLSRQLKWAEYWMLPVLMVAVLQSTGFFKLPEIVNKIFITYHISFFIAGISFYKIINKTSDRFTIPLILISLVSTAFIISFKHFLVFSFFYTGFYLAISGRLRFLSFKPFVFLGGISYSLYLIHQNVGFVILNKFSENQLPTAPGAFLSIVLCVIAASLLNRYVEKPALSAIREFYRSNRRMKQIADMFAFNRQNVSSVLVSDKQTHGKIGRTQELSSSSAGQEQSKSDSE